MLGIGLNIPCVATLGDTTDAAAVALFARMSPAPSVARQVQINRLIADLKGAGAWDSMEVLYVLAAHDAQAARLNWKGNASYDLTAVAAPTFTEDRGYAGNGSTSYLNTGWTPTGVHTQNDAGMGIYLNAGTDTASNAANPMGCNDASSRFCSILPRSTSDTVRGAMNDNNTGNFTPAALTTRFGLTVVERTAAAVRTAYRDGVAVGGGTVASTGVPTTPVWLGARNNNGVVAGATDNRIALAFAGASLGAAKNAAVYTAFARYLTAVGAA
jgi:hypothetical protein